MFKKMPFLKLALVGLIVVAFTYGTNVAYATTPIVYMVDVNRDGYKHGDAYLIIDGNNVALIDTANYKSANEILIPFIKSLGIQRINKLIFTHGHTDHVGGVPALIQAGIKIDRVYHNALPNGVSDWNHKPSEYQATIQSLIGQGADVINLERGDIFKLGNSQFDVIYSEKRPSFQGRKIIVNDYSLMLMLTANGSRMLFTGDSEVTLATRLPGELDLSADIVTMQHHGGHNVGDLKFYQNVGAPVHLYSSTKEIFNLISGGARQITKSVNATLCHSGYHGLVTISFYPGNFKVQSANQSDCSKTFSSKKLGSVEHHGLTSQRKNASLSAIILELLHSEI